MVDLVGFEPTTPCLQGRCSPRLSYKPILVRMTRVELVCLAATVFETVMYAYSITSAWYARRGSNPDSLGS